MPTPDFILELRRHVGHSLLWIPSCTAVVLRRSFADAGSALPEVLIVRRSDNGAWALIEGIVDPGEEPAAACVRETLEEAGVVAMPKRLLGVEVVGPTTYENGDIAAFLDVTFVLEWVSGEPYPADEENTRAEFVRLDELPSMEERYRRLIARAVSGHVVAYFFA